MSLGSSDMAGGALGTAFSLLLLASIIQGLRDVQMFHEEKMEAIAGQDVTLPCIIKNSTGLQIVSIEWRKNRNGNTKLALYSSAFGRKLFWPNVTLQIENRSIGSYLHLSGVTKWDSDIYICDLTTFPLGSIRRETELEIKDAEIICDVDGAVEVHAGENVTINCTRLPNVQYKWTKNKKLVSENESLELSWVTDTHTGVYTLTVSTGNTSLHKEFIITVLTATTSLSHRDLVTVSPQSNVTEDGLVETTDSGITTSPTTGFSTTDTKRTGTGVTDDNPNPTNATITAGEHVTSYKNHTHISTTSSPVTHTDRYHFNNSNQEINPTRTLNTSTLPDQSVASYQPTTLSNGSKVFRPTQETRNESVPHTVHPVVNSSTCPEESSTLGSITENSGATPTQSILNIKASEDEDTNGVRSHLLLVLIILPMLVLIAVAGLLYRKQIIKQRMDLPPPFKPPPPPVKYTAARNSEISAQPFPSSRCNSVTQLKDMKLRCTDV
ncbi:T-cell surface protein tactile [Chelmon rostratus]|uniref:T-cell surface protein tactile n=1 Tax=Chelmon rostratus TaxID=109905 RepID=UPI001BE7F83A|nr:T-cell surface protein tactile [Chelmon rostratus]